MQVYVAYSWKTAQVYLNVYPSPGEPPSSSTGTREQDAINSGIRSARDHFPWCTTEHATSLTVGKGEDGEEEGGGRMGGGTPWWAPLQLGSRAYFIMIFCELSGGVVHHHYSRRHPPTATPLIHHSLIRPQLIVLLISVCCVMPWWGGGSRGRGEVKGKWCREDSHWCEGRDKNGTTVGHVE